MESRPIAMDSSSRILTETIKVRPRQFHITEDYQPAPSNSTPHASSAPALLEGKSFLERDLSESTFQMVDTFTAVKNQPIHIFDLTHKIKNTSSNSFHKVYKVSKLNKKTDACYFFKVNKTHSLMSELEAAACHFYQYLIPGYVPTAHAHFDPKNSAKPCVGISSKGIPGFKSTMEDPLTMEDLKNKTIVKGLAHCLAASYIFEEDDLHRGNMAKTGHRIDFDMSLWTILCRYKESGYIDWTFRYPDNQTFVIDEEDIRHFPNIKKAKPFYWPTNPAPIIPQSIRIILSALIPISKNSFSDRDNVIYQFLEKDETFKYESNKVFLKYILTNFALFRDISRLHIKPESEHLIMVMGKHQMHRIRKLSEVWRRMPEFKEFIMHDGKQALGEIIREQTAWNEKIQEKLIKHPEREKELKPLLIDIDDTRKTFSSFVEEAMQCLSHSM